MSNRVGKLLRKHRKVFFDKESVRAASVRTGVSPSHISRIESGVYTPNRRTLKSLMRGMKLTRAEKFELYVLCGCYKDFMAVGRQLVYLGMGDKIIEFFRRAKH